MPFATARRFAAVLLCLFGLVGLLAPAAALAADPRGASHDGYGRMVFDWPSKTVFSAEVIAGQLVVRFDRPITGDPKALLKPLGRYLTGARLSADRKSVAFTLTGPMQVRSFLAGNNTVVDLVADPKAKPQPQAKSEPKAEPKPDAGPEAKPAGGRVVVRVGEHTGFHRVVFDWTQPVGYTVKDVGGKAVVNFDKAAEFDVSALRAGLPGDVTLAEVKPGTLTLALPDGMRARHYRSGQKVVVDLVRAAGAAPPPAMAGKAPPPPVAEVEEAAPSIAAKAEPTPKTPVEALAERAPEMAQAAKAAAEEPRPNFTASLSFTWSEPTAAAVFRRAGWLWIVFDRPQQVDLTLMKRLSGGYVEYIEQVPIKGATVLRALVAPDINPSLRTENLLWIVDLQRQPMKPKVPLDVSVRSDLSPYPAWFVAVQQAGSMVTITDPEVGDQIKVVPVIPLGAGIEYARGAPEADLLASAQGIAVVPRADGVEVKSSRKGVDVTAPAGGLSINTSVDPGHRKATGLFDIGAWKRGGPDKFTSDRKVLLDSLALLAPDRRNAARLELARFHVANGFAADALGLLRIAVAEDPAIENSDEFRAVRGVASALMYRFREAAEDFGHPSLQTNPAARFWKAVAETGYVLDPSDQGHAMSRGLDVLGDYPAPVRIKVAFLAIDALLASGDDLMVRDLIEMLSQEKELLREDKARLAYLDGRFNEQHGSFDKALDSYQTAEEAGSRPWRARAAVARIELSLRVRKIKNRDAIEQLDKLRFAWREGDFEFPLLYRLGELQIGEGMFGDGLRTLRQLTISYGDHKDIGAVQKMMADAFDALYYQGAAERLSPVTAIALFDEFRDLTPTGAKGDEMIRRLADRLASVDLLDRAGELLEHQVKFRLGGLERARVGTRLAVVRLLDHKPQAALDALAASESPDIPDDLAEQRRHLRARALADIDQVAEAVSLLVGDTSGDGRLLRAEIHWRKGNWEEAAAAFEAMVPKPERGGQLADAQARLVLTWAAALTLAGDERGLSALRRGFAPAMALTNYKDGFTLLTSEQSRGVIDHRTVSARIKEAEKFQSFLGGVRERMLSQGLSGLN